MPLGSKYNKDTKKIEAGLSSLILSKLQEALTGQPCEIHNISTELYLEDDEIKFNSCCPDQENLVTAFLDEQIQ